ncbi:MAG: hypothetical protein AABZ33_14180 [Chloroflexota bacterium]
MRRLLAIAALGVIMLIAMVVVAIVLLSSPGEEGLDLGYSGFLVILFAALWLYWGLGAVIVVRADGHAVGWLFAVAAALMASVFGCNSLGYMLASRLPPDPLGGWLSLVAALLFPPAIILTLPAVALTFPTGSLPGPRWRWPVGLVAAMVVVGTLAIVFRPGPISAPGTDNPLTPWLPAVSPGMLEALGALAAIGSLSLPLGTGLGVAAMIVRFRRSQGDQQQQLKWFLAAMAPAAVLITMSVSGVLSSLPVIDLLTVMTLPIVAVSVAIGILRYRLYDIDRIVSRTIAYGLITALLVAVFLLVNLGLQGLLSSVTSGNSLAVAGSTLLAAALFTPVRRRVQRIVDRRFDRARYDGERTAGAFSVRMRDATDLPTVAHDLDATVRRAIAPSHLGLWLRGSGR